MSVRRKAALAVRLALVTLFTCVGILHLVSRSVRTQAENQTPNHVRVPVVTDWSHRHMIYSRPSSTAQTLRLQAEPRYLQQLARRNPAALQGTN
jgi:hypothetical protein